MDSRLHPPSPTRAIEGRSALRERFENRGSRPSTDVDLTKVSPKGYNGKQKFGSDLGRTLYEALLRSESKENRNNEDRDNIRDLDHRINCRARGVFVRIAHGIARDRRLVRKRSFAAEVAFFDELLRIIP